MKKEVDTILGGLCKARKSHRTIDKYDQKARYPSWVAMPSTNVCLSGGITQKPKDIVFTKAYANWVHHPHKDALIIMANIANNLVHRILVVNGSTVNILYRHAYQKIGLTWVDLSPTTSPLYRFTGDHVVPE